MNYSFNSSFIQLPDPKTGIPITFLQSGKKLLSLQSSELRRHSSFFINQRVSSDGHFYFGTNYDPRFLILPFLEKNASKFSPLDQIVTFVNNCSRIPLENSNNWNIDEIADMNDKLGDDMILYRHNLQKVILWLKQKVNAISTELMRQRLANEKITNGNIVNSVDFSFQSIKNITQNNGVVKDPAELSPSSEDVKKAVIIISDYITDNVLKSLLDSYGFTEAMLNEQQSKKVEAKRKSDWEEELEVSLLDYLNHTSFLFPGKNVTNLAFCFSIIT